MKRVLAGILSLGCLSGCPQQPSGPCFPLSLNWDDAQVALVGQPFSKDLRPEGPLKLSYAMTLPEGLEGLTLSPEGMLEGVPRKEGKFELAVSVTQACANTTLTTSLTLPLRVWVPACAEKTNVSTPPDFFTDVSEASGVRAVFTPNAVAAQHNTVQYTEVVDFDGDGFDELVLHGFFIAANEGVPYRHQVLKNNRNGTFTDISDKTGFAGVVAQAFAYGDIDNDGDVDVISTVPLPSPGAKARVFLNTGNFTFTEVATTGLEKSQPYAISAVLADFNNDARLDLFLAQGYSSRPLLDELYFGQGDGTFTNGSKNLAGQVARQSNSAVACDYDNDGDRDLFVAMYGVSHLNGHNVLWQNQGDGTFVNVAEAAGFAFEKTGNYLLSSTGKGLSPQPSAPYIGNNSFDIVCEDINNDGHLDIYLSAISHPDSDFKRTWSDPTRLLINQGPQAGYVFSNEFLQRKLLYNEGDIDISVGDVNNDGRWDLSAQRETKYEARYPTEEYRAWLGLMLQLPDGTFQNISFTSGLNAVGKPELGKSKGTGAHAFFDFDRDGDMDLAWGGANYSTGDFPDGRPVVLFRNDFGNQNPWLQLLLKGDGLIINRSAYGATATLRWADFQITRSLNGSHGHMGGASTQLLQFGLAGRDCDFVLEVQWPDGTQATFDGAALGRNQAWEVRYPDQLNLLKVDR